MHAALRFHLTQLVMLLLWVLLCAFGNRVKSGRSVNSNLPWKSRIPQWPCRSPARRRAYPSMCSLGGCRGCHSEGIFNVRSGTAAFPHSPTSSASPRLHQPSVSSSLPLSPFRVSPCCVSGCTVGLCRLSTAPIWSPGPCAPWAMSHTASMHGKSFSL